MGPQYFQNPFYDWNSFAGAMNSIAQYLHGPAGVLARRANTPLQQGGMPQQRLSMQSPLQQDIGAGFNSAARVAASLPANRYVQDMNATRYFNTQQDFTPAMPYMDYDPRYMDPMGPLGNVYYQQPETPYAIDRAVSQFENSLPQISPYGRTAYPRDVEKL